MYRKFYLVNGNGTTQTLTDPKVKVFADNPSGLGFNTAASYLRLGNESLLTYQQYSMVQKNFDIKFYEDSIDKMYDQYNKFIKFLTIKPIYLLYEVNKKVYRMKVNVESLSKGQISHMDGMLTCQISMAPLTFWEDNVANIIEVTKQSLEGKSYELERPYSYGSLTTDNVEINSIGTLDAALKITITGAATNPQYNLYDENDTLYGSGKIIGQYDYISVDADEAEESIVLKKNGVIVENPYNYQDLTVGIPGETYVTFLKMKPGNNRMSFNLDAGFNGNIKIEWRNRYVSV